MFIGVCGGIIPPSIVPASDQSGGHPALITTWLGICAGKSSVASFLVQEHGFKKLHLERLVVTPSVETSAAETTVPHDDVDDTGEGRVFKTPEALSDYVTARWREHWVTTDIWDEGVLDVLLRRPFFLLVSVDAPVSVRWERFKSRYLLYHSEPLIPWFIHSSKY